MICYNNLLLSLISTIYYLNSSTCHFSLHTLFKGGVQLFEFACIKIRWFLSVRHLKWMNTPNFENFLRIYSPWKIIPKFLVKNKLCGRKRDMNVIETCPFAVLSSLVMTRSPRKDFVISWKMGPELISPFLSYHSLPKLQKLIFFAEIWYASQV